MNRKNSEIFRARQPPCKTKFPQFLMFPPRLGRFGEIGGVLCVFVCFGVVLPFSYSDFSVLVFFSRKQQNLGVLAWFCLFLNENNKICVFWRGFVFWLLFHRKEKIGCFGVVLPFFLPKTIKFGCLARFCLFCSDFSVLVVFFSPKKNKITISWLGSLEQFFFSPKTTKFGCFGVVLRFGCFVTEKKKLWVFWRGFAFFTENNKISVFWRGFALFFALILVFWLFFHKKKNYDFLGSLEQFTFFLLPKKQPNLCVLEWSCVLVVFSPKKTTKFGCFGVVLRFGCFFPEKKNKIWVFWRGFASFYRKQQNLGLFLL